MAQLNIPSRCESSWYFGIESVSETDPAGSSPASSWSLDLGEESRPLAVPEIKIGKGTRRSAIELRQPKPTIGFEPIPAAYKAK